MNKYLFIILYIGIILTLAPSCELTPISTTTLSEQVIITNTSTNISTNTIDVSITNASTNIYSNTLSTTNTMTNVFTNVITNMIEDLFDDPITNIYLVEKFFPQKEVVYQKKYGEKPNILYENFYLYRDGRIGIILSGVQDKIYSVSGFIGNLRTNSISSVTIKQKNSTISIDKSLYSNYVVGILAFDKNYIFGISRGENIIEFPYLMKIESSSLTIIPLIDLGFFYQIVGDEKVFSRVL